MAKINTKAMLNNLFNTMTDPKSELDTICDKVIADLSDTNDIQNDERLNQTLSELDKAIGDIRGLQLDELRYLIKKCKSGVNNETVMFISMLLAASYKK